MAIKAVDKNTGEVVISTFFVESLTIRAKYPHLVCPECGDKMSARGGRSKKVVTHFFHIKQDGRKCLVADKHKNRRSLTHHTLMVKAAYDYLIKEIPPGFSLDFEHRSKDVPDRIADLAVLDCNGKMVQAHEIQLTKVTTGELEERTESYESAGVEVIWWFGKGCDTEELIAWAKASFGYCLIPEISFFNQEATFLEVDE